MQVARVRWAGAEQFIALAPSGHALTAGLRSRIESRAGTDGVAVGRARHVHGSGRGFHPEKRSGRSWSRSRLM